MSDCIFCKIAGKRVPTDTIYGDGEMLYFKDTHPAIPVHLLLIPKARFGLLAHVQSKHEALLGEMVLKASQITEESGLTNGFKVVINTGKGGRQEAFHLHVHIIGALA